MKKKVFIEGMSCEHCVNHVKEALNELEGVTSVYVSLEDKMAMLESSITIGDGDIQYIIGDAGYDVSRIELL